MTSFKTQFGFTSTAEEVSEGIDLTGQRALVTGGASGIGMETARVLALRGAEVTIAARDFTNGNAAAEELIRKTGNKRIRAQVLDLANLQSVVEFVNRWEGPLNILVNNAGIMASPEQYTAHGVELQFATNHLGHFALASGLHRFLADAKRSRIVSVSSTGHLFSPVVFDDINYAFRAYDPVGAYGQSKSAVNLFAVAATARWKHLGITANALNPGAIKTNLQRHVGSVLKSPPEYHKSIEQGAATSVFLASSPLVEGIGGRYFNDCNEATRVERRPKELPQMFNAVAGYSANVQNAQRLWDESTRLVLNEISASYKGWFE